MQKRICIYAKDIQMITGRTERYGNKLLIKIRRHFKKEKHHMVTITEFCEYTGLPFDEVVSYIRD
jgi:hypothetical protein